MKATSLFLALALPLAMAAAQAQQPDPAATASASKHVMIDADQLQWGAAPPFLPAGVQLAVLSGDPGQDGMFVLRLKMPAGYVIPRHWHPTDEHVTVIAGELALDMGDGAPMHRLGPGGYALLPAKMPHEATAANGATVQVSGLGPFLITYVDPKDDPREQAQPAQE